MTSDSPILVTVAGGKFAPVVNQVAVLLGHGLVGVGQPYRLGFAPDANVRILFLDPVHETVIIVILPVPHSVLDVPVEKTQGLDFLFLA